MLEIWVKSSEFVIPEQKGWDGGTHGFYFSAPDSAMGACQR